MAVFANFTKSTSSFPPLFFCFFNLLQMVRLLHLELLRDTLRTVSKPTTQFCSRFSERRGKPLPGVAQVAFQQGRQEGSNQGSKKNASRIHHDTHLPQLPT